MRKLLFFAIFIIFLTCSNPSAEIYLNFGLDVNSLHWDNEFINGNWAGFGFMIACSYKLQLKSEFTLDIGIGYSIKSFYSEIYYYDYYTSSDWIFNFNILKIPILINYFLEKNVYLILGMTFANEISGELEIDGSSEEINYRGLENDIYLTLGIGTKTLLGFDSISAQFLFEYNITPDRDSYYWAPSNFEQYSLAAVISFKL